MSEMEKMEKTPGNTKNRALQSKYWCFTVFQDLENGEMGWETLESIFKEECSWFIFQEEKCPKTGNIHIQGILCLLKKQRLTELKKLDPSIHWERTKSVKASIAYCTKKETRYGKQCFYGIEIPEEIEIDEPYGWQLDVINIINQKPDKRTIHWFWEEKGNMGKSTLCKYLIYKYDALIVSGKSNDMLYAVKTAKKKKIILVDVPRSQQDFINYGALEMIKNGAFFAGKYESSQVIYNYPHLIVFANTPPLRGQMSEDRIIEHYIGQN